MEMWARFGISFLCAQNVALRHHNLRKGLKGLSRSLEDLSRQSSPTPQTVSTKTAAPFSPASRTALTLRIEDDSSRLETQNFLFLSQKGMYEVWWQAQVRVLSWEGIQNPMNVWMLGTKIII